MSDLLGGCIVAFSLYSALPMPQRAWTEENMRYPFCFFPLIGLPIGGALWAWQWVCTRLGFGQVLFAAGAAAIPLLITGGIHLDGFCDTVDALSSHQSRERMLEILKDPHLGAFGAMGLVVYLLTQFALFTEFPSGPVWLALLGVGYCLSRTLSGLAVVTFRCAKNSGLVYAFADQAARKTVGRVLLVWLMLLGGLLLWLAPREGAVLLAVALAVFVFYRWASYRWFGGITGDLAGWFLQLCEWMILAAIVWMGRGIA